MIIIVTKSKTPLKTSVSNKKKSVSNIDKLLSSIIYTLKSGVVNAKKNITIALNVNDVITLCEEPGLYTRFSHRGQWYS
jgi:hypothetical protein